MSGGVLTARAVPRSAGAMVCLALGVADLVLVNAVVVPRMRAGTALIVAASPTSANPIRLTPTPTDTPSASPDTDARAPAPIALHFSTGQARLDDDAREILAQLSAQVAAHPGWTLVIEGHTDARGDERFNRRLSQLRARMVALQLRELGVGGQRMRARGFGAARPVAEGDDEAALRLNRRVEIVIARRAP
jgi:outer membrane protein OmpA-like peptidoglycan-associated protein